PGKRHGAHRRPGRSLVDGEPAADQSHCALWHRGEHDAPGAGTARVNVWPAGGDRHGGSPAGDRTYCGREGDPVTPGNAVKAGSAVTIFWTGLGEVTPAVQAGNNGPALPGGAATVTPVTVTVGNVNAAVQYAGLAPGMVGLY